MGRSTDEKTSADTSAAEAPRQVQHDLAIGVPDHGRVRRERAELRRVLDHALDLLAVWCQDEYDPTEETRSFLCEHGYVLQKR